jgi:hypothetical protein
MLDVRDAHSASQQVGQLGHVSRAPSFVALTSLESQMQTMPPQFTPMRSTYLPTCVATSPAFHTDAENANFFLYATSAVNGTMLPSLADRTGVFTSLQNRDMSVARLHKQAQQGAAVSAQGSADQTVEQYTVTQPAPSTAALSTTLLKAPQVKDASQTAVGQASNGVQAARTASAELQGNLQCVDGVPVLARMSDDEPRPAVRTTCVKMPAPRKVCGRADTARSYVELWAEDVQRYAQCSDITVQEGLDMLTPGDARVQVEIMLRDGRTVHRHASPNNSVCTDGPCISGHQCVPHTRACQV